MTDESCTHQTIESVSTTNQPIMITTKASREKAESNALDSPQNIIIQLARKTRAACTMP